MDWQFSYDTTSSLATQSEVSEESRHLITRVRECALKLTSDNISDFGAWSLLLAELKLGIEQGIPIFILEEASGLRSPTLELLVSGKLHIQDLLPTSTSD